MARHSVLAIVGSLLYAVFRALCDCACMIPLLTHTSLLGAYLPGPESIL